MRNILKKALCLCLALCMAVSLGACYSEDNTWVAKHGDDVMPVGAYLYYLTSAYTEAGNRVSANEKVWDASIDGQSVKDWSKDRALQYVGAYYYICDKFDELGLTLTEADLNAIDNGANSLWAYYKDSMETAGISEASFKKAYAEHNVRAQLVLQAMYGEGGEKEVSESELSDYYTENYWSYEYMYVSKSKFDEDGNSVALEDDELKELQDTLQEYADKVNDGDMTFAEAYSEYSTLSATTPQHEAPGATKKDSVHTNISSELPDMEDGEVKLVEVDAGIYLVEKLSIEDYFDSLMEDESQKNELLTEYKGTEFNDDAMEQGKALNGVEVNQKCINSVKLDKVVANKDQTGASVAPTDDNAESQAESEAADE